MLNIQKGEVQTTKNKKSKVIDINKGFKNGKSKAELKRNRNREVLYNKILDYDLVLDKKQLKDEMRLLKTKKDNEFKYKEVDIKCDMKNLALKAGYTLGKVCLILTFISCFLTLGGNIKNFICNIPLTTEEATEAILKWKDFEDTYTIIDGVKTLNYSYLGFNIVTTLIYIPFLFGMQSILYQISLCIYIIKTRFKEYYKYALLLQFSMLFYSVYSNYIFISYYVRPESIVNKVMCFIPSLLLDISCIFFLSLSMRMKTLNFDDKEIDKQQNFLISGLNTIGDFKGKFSTIFKQKDKVDVDLDKLKKSPNLRLKLALNKSEYRLKNSADLDKIMKMKIDKNSTKKEENTILESTGNSSDGNKNTVQNKPKKTGNFKAKEPTGQATNKVKDKELNKVREFIKKLQKNEIKTVSIKELKKYCKVDKNKWLEIKEILINEGYIYVLEGKPRTTFIKY